jgi:hypothetical protein
MTMLAFFATIAMLGAVFALACGVAAMVSDGEVLRLRSEEWMGWRVAWQAIAVLFAALLLATAAYGSAPVRAECVYDYPMLTAQECRAYRAGVLRATSDEERLTLLRNVNERMEARARERGTTPDDWRGLALVALAAGDSAAGHVATTGTQIAVSAAMLALIVVVAFFVFRTLWPMRNVLLKRCPETGGISFVGIERVLRGKEPAVEVRSCDLWPQRKDCARGCLARYDDSAPWFPVNIDQLRPFDHR